jgi:hypothetical protein
MPLAHPIASVDFPFAYSRKRQSGRMSTKKGVIGILTGGGDVPGLNPAIRAVTIRALREGYQVVGIRHGWLGAMSILRDEHADNSEHFQILTEEIVNRAARTGGTFLHTSRTNPSAVKKEEVPEALRATFTQDKNDLTSEVIKNLDWLGIDYLIPIGGDDTLSFAPVCLGKESRSWRYPRRWTMTCQAPIIALALAHASAGRLNCRIVSAPRPDLTSDFWLWKCSDATRGLPRCCQRWRAPRIGALSPNTNSTWSI